MIEGGSPRDYPCLAQGRESLSPSFSIVFRCSTEEGSMLRGSRSIPRSTGGARSEKPGRGRRGPSESFAEQAARFHQFPIRIIPGEKKSEATADEHLLYSAISS